MSVSIASLEARPTFAAAAAPSPGWILDGSFPADYVTRTDGETAHGGKASAVLAASAASPRGVGALMQRFAPREFVGKRVPQPGRAMSRIE